MLNLFLRSDFNKNLIILLSNSFSRGRLLFLCDIREEIGLDYF